MVELAESFTCFREATGGRGRTICPQNRGKRALSRAKGTNNSPEAKPAGHTERRLKTWMAGVADSIQRRPGGRHRMQTHLPGPAGYLPRGEKPLRGPERWEVTSNRGGGRLTLSPSEVALLWTCFRGVCACVCGCAEGMQVCECVARHFSEAAWRVSPRDPPASVSQMLGFQDHMATHGLSFHMGAGDLNLPLHGQSSPQPTN